MVVVFFSAILTSHQVLSLFPKMERQPRARKKYGLWPQTSLSKRFLNALVFRFFLKNRDSQLGFVEDLQGLAAHRALLISESEKENYQSRAEASLCV